MKPSALVCLALLGIVAHTAIAQDKWAGISGLWTLEANGYKGKLEITTSTGGLNGRIYFDTHHAWEGLRDITYDSATATLRFLRPGPAQWHTGVLRNGVVEGTFTQGGSGNYKWKAWRGGEQKTIPGQGQTSQVAWPLGKWESWVGNETEVKEPWGRFEFNADGTFSISYFRPNEIEPRNVTIGKWEAHGNLLTIKQEGEKVRRDDGEWVWRGGYWANPIHGTALGSDINAKFLLPFTTSEGVATGYWFTRELAQPVTDKPNIRSVARHNIAGRWLCDWMGRYATFKQDGDNFKATWSGGTMAGTFVESDVVEGKWYSTNLRIWNAFRLVFSADGNYIVAGFWDRQSGFAYNRSNDVKGRRDGLPPRNSPAAPSVSP